MDDWQIDVWTLVESAKSEEELFNTILASVKQLGFEYCAYGMQMPYPFSSTKAIMLNNYPEAWRKRYDAAQYLNIDPTVRHALRSQEPLVWSDELFSQTPELWEEARAVGLRVGWAQSSLDKVGASGMLTVARSSEILTASELAAQEDRLRWLVSLAHVSLDRMCTERFRKEQAPELTQREREVLKWTADGKSALEVSDILDVSKNTIDFHIKNAVRKLQTANKTAAVVRAAMLGLLF